jgi:hypothetical protein
MMGGMVIGVILVAIVFWALGIGAVAEGARNRGEGPAIWVIMAILLTPLLPGFLLMVKGIDPMYDEKKRIEARRLRDSEEVDHEVQS